jgi:hypothetical protein
MNTMLEPRIVAASTYRRADFSARALDVFASAGGEVVEVLDIAQQKDEMRSTSIRIESW